MSRFDAESLSEATELLSQPFAHEDLGLRDVPVFTVLVPSAPAPPFDATKAFTAELRALPAVTIAVVADRDPSVPLNDNQVAGLAGFDVIFAEPAAAPNSVDPAAGDHPDIDAALAHLINAVADNPLAATTAVQLLRMSESLSVRDALVAESLAYATLQSGAEFQRWLADHRTRRATRKSRKATAAEPQSSAPQSSESQSSESHVLSSQSDGQLALALNRPARRNAFSAAMRDALVTALRVGSADPAVETITVSGRGAAFCSGGDLDEFGTAPDPVLGHQVRMVRSAGWWIHANRVPVSFELHGACVGAGIELPSFGSHVQATKDTIFRLPEVGMGLVPGAGGTVSIPRRIGRQRATWLTITGKSLKSETALDWKLVDELVERRRDE